jgi:energy-coupling factor transporter ATP-binding protein EcfA2
MDPDISFNNVVELIGKYTSQQIRSEADTRCKVIDLIFSSVLGWEENNITREERNDEGYTDYIFRINEIPYFVVEAKKTGEVFDIPNKINKRKYKIKGVLQSVENLNEAIMQARMYCINTGIKYAIVTNGYQYIIFSAFSTNKKWEDAECILFNGFSDIKNNFSLFWNILSKETVSNGSLFEYIEKGELHLTFKKIYFDIHNKDQKWARNRLYTYLRPICDFVFTELLDEAKTRVLNECYVFERSNRNLGENFDELFIDKLPYFASNYSIIDIYEREKKAGAFEKEFNRNIEEASLILLLGGVGSGKSTFLHRFFKIVQSNKETLFWFYFDFRESPFEENKIEDYIFNSLYKQYKQLYEEKVKDILADIGFNQNSEDKPKYIFHLFNLFKRIGINIVLIIDNVDQHEYNFQQKLFIYSNHISKELGVLTLLSIREETFLQSTQTGVFDAYDIPKFHISSPNFLNLIKKRIEFTIDFIKSDFFVKNSKSISNEIRTDLIHYFEILLRSLSKDNDQSRQIVRFFDNVSVGNMREALSMFNSFLISGNTNVTEMFQKENEKDEDVFQIAFHQLLKSIMLDEYRFYCSDRSRIANIFDFDLSLDYSHFNQLRILKVLIDKENTKSKMGRGYFEIDSLISMFSKINLKKERVIDCLKRLSFLSLVVYDNQSKANAESATFIKITASGKLYYTDLIYQFGYIEAIVVDTPISSEKSYQEIRKLINEDDLPSRLIKTKIFIEYLINAERQDIENNASLTQNDFVNTIFMEKIKISFNTFIEKLTSKLIIDSKEKYLIS